MTEHQICLRVDVRRALGELTEKQRHAVLAMGVLGLTQEEYARAVGISRQMAQKSFRRAGCILRRFLCPYELGSR